MKRVPLARGEKKTWRVERERKEVVSTGEVTSTSEEGRMDQVSSYWLISALSTCSDWLMSLQVLAVSGQEYGKENWERIWRPRGPRPLAGESLAPEKRYAHGIPSSMLVTANTEQAGKLDKFGQLKITAVEMEGYGSEKVESHDWLKEEDDGSNSATATQEVVQVPKDLQCPLCSDLLSAAVLLPCCVAAACDECARNMLVENELKCGLCEETDISPDDLIPNPMLRKKAAAFKNKGKEETRIQLQPLPKLLTGNSIVPAEIMLQRQKVEEEKKKIIIEERKLVEAVMSNTNITDQETPSDNVPLSVSPSDTLEDSDKTETLKEEENPTNTNDQLPVTSEPSLGDDGSPSEPQPLLLLTEDNLKDPSVTPERARSKSPSPDAQIMSSTVATPPPSSLELAPVPDSTASPRKQH